jgi:hypothetical protein
VRSPQSQPEPSASPRFWLVFAGLALGCVYPLYHTRYAPLQDLPQHLAAIRILHDFADPALRFARYFEIDLLRTQYLAYYLTVDLLAYLVDVERANEWLVAVTMIGTPLAACSLLGALGKDQRMGLLCFPLAYNAHLILGFFNFLSAIPLSLYGVALALRQRDAPTRRRALGLGVLAVICFYTHVVPFGLMCLAISLLALARPFASAWRAVVPLVPSALAALFWLRHSPAGQATTTAVAGANEGPEPVFMPRAAALEQTGRWLTDVFSGDEDQRMLWTWAGLVAVVVVVAVAERAWSWWRARKQPTAVPDAGKDGSAGKPSARAYEAAVIWALALLCAGLYFVAPTSYDWIWPIAPRFPLLAAIWLVIALPDGRWLRRGVLVAGFLLSVASFHFAGKAFARFDQDEVGDFDQALAAIPQGQRVVGLIFDRHSHNAAFSPFIHFVAYYQARKGGAVMFSFADFPQSPFRFREQNRPPRVPPRWEWLPERVRPRGDLDFFDYALVRGGPGAIARPNSGFTLRYRGIRWSVFEHTGAVGIGSGTP